MSELNHVDSNNLSLAVLQLVVQHRSDYMELWSSYGPHADLALQSAQL